jgi:transcription elongation GreA/GreB family factor
VSRLTTSDDSALEQARLERLAEELSQTRNPQQVLDAVTSSGVAAAGARAGMIALLNDEATRLQIVAWRGFSEKTMREWEQSAIVSSRRSRGSAAAARMHSSACR